MDARYIKNKLKALSEEEKIKEINRIRMEMRLFAWRKEMLKAYREMASGTFYPEPEV